MSTKSVVFYVLVALLALGVNASFAQSLDDMQQPDWIDQYMEPQQAPAAVPAGQHSSGWWPHVVEACSVHGCDPNYLMSIIQCESNGDESAAAYNPSSGNMTYGLLQIDEQWGSIAYAGGVEQIWWAAAHLGEVWWACG